MILFMLIVLALTSLSSLETVNSLVHVVVIGLLMNSEPENQRRLSLYLSMSKPRVASSAGLSSDCT